MEKNVKRESIRQNETEEQKLERLEHNFSVAVYLFVLFFVVYSILRTVLIGG